MVYLWPIARRSACYHRFRVTGGTYCVSCLGAREDMMDALYVWIFYHVSKEDLSYRARSGHTVVKLVVS